MKVCNFLLIFALAVMLSGCVQGGGYEKTGSNAVSAGNSLGQKAPNFSLTDINGNNISLTNFKGEPVVMWFFAAWCATCIPEAKALSQIHKAYHDKGVEVVMIDVWPGETLEDLNRFMKAAGTSVEDGFWAFDTGEVAVIYGVRSLDTTFVIDRRGFIAYKDERPTDYSTLSRELEKVL
jgi:peroxiredoxin